MIRSRSGFIAVLGSTNVGKSTVMNRILQQKMAITSHRTQTTRYATALVLTEERGQIIFMDTPGFHRPHCLLNRMMIKEASLTLKNCDLLLHVVSPDIAQEDDSLMKSIKSFKRTRVLAINKIDLLNRSERIENVARYASMKLYDEIVPISAVTGDNMEKLLEICFGLLPEGPNLYPEDYLSDKTERFFMAEIIREKVILLTRQELPYTTAVVIDDSKWIEKNNMWKIAATVYVEKTSQKGIVIGSEGSMLKNIGQRARHELELFLDARVYLELWVKVRKNWTSDPVFLREIGYTHPD